LTIPTQSRQWLDIASTTLENWRPMFYDQITDAIPLIKVAKSRDSVLLDGGDNILETLMYAQNNTVGSYSGYDLMDLTPQETFTKAKYDWKDIAGSVVFSQDDIDRNRGAAQQLNLLKARQKNLKLSYASALNTMLHSDGTGNSSKDLNGLQNLVHGRSSGTIGGINRDEETWWRNVSYAYSTPTAGWYGAQQGGTANTVTARESIGGTADNYDTTFIHVIEYVFEDVTFGDTGPNFMITNQEAMSRLKRTMLDDKRFSMADTERADPGFRHVNFNGVPVVWDRAMTVGLGTTASTCGVLYYLNLDFMNFYIHSGNNFRNTEIYPLLPQQNAFAALLFLKAEWTSNKQNAQAVLTNLL